MNRYEFEITENEMNIVEGIRHGKEIKDVFAESGLSKTDFIKAISSVRAKFNSRGINLKGLNA